ncbi:hypothetical protein NEOLI_005204 [Neolecta irregularis DAH-3]|uniref:DUF7603 domain-containing protein n=1 Tax=Neolecta irregularis (strain DAH-3) TaxID=1198029 RepID=A0A1U7LJC0_NEOID|nr:hypothetical protein NEOLI_005204 [Neolecta irregularis DAH-3]|eukprot:OLL22693.1 hypothetical protein NEOLI_005204 [Neolecta irregularis DAH-3]
MDLEDLVAQLQDDVDLALRGGKPHKRQYRTSDYFSDAGFGSPGSRPSLEDRQAQLERRVRELDVSSEHEARLHAPPDVARLQAVLEDARRKYAEERSAKQGLEDIVAMNKVQLAALQDERDQLQHDVVPTLRDRLAALQQAAQHLRIEKDRLASRLQCTEQQLQAKSDQSKSDQAANQQDPAQFPKLPLQKSPAPPLDTERIKEIETQRDALHQSLRALRERQTFESKKSATKIQALERELYTLRPSLDRSRPFHSLNSSPLLHDDTKRRLHQKSKSLLESSIQADLSNLRKENTTLLEKVCDYDKLVKANEQLGVSQKTLQSRVSELERQSQDDSALENLRVQHDLSLVKIDKLEASLSAALGSRNLAESQHVDSNHLSEQKRLQEENSLAKQLSSTIVIVEDLAGQVRTQLESNNSLRTRLTDVISQAAQEESYATQRIEQLVSERKQLKQSIQHVRNESDESLKRYETELGLLSEQYRQNLRCIKETAQKVFPTTEILDPLLKTPRLPWNIKSTPETSRVMVLEEQVAELNRMLTDTSLEMRDVIMRMQTAQMEIIELMQERDDANRQLRKFETDR